MIGLDLAKERLKTKSFILSTHKDFTNNQRAMPLLSSLISEYFKETVKLLEFYYLYPNATAETE